MVKQEHLIIAGAVGVAGIIGFSLLSPEEKEKLIPIPAGGIDLSGLFAGFKFPEIEFPEFPDIITTITQPFSALAEKAQNVITTGQDIIEGIGETATNIAEAPGKFLEATGTGAKDFARSVTSALVTISPFGFGEEIGRRLPLGTFLGDFVNDLTAQAPGAVSAPEFAEKTKRLLGIRAEQTKIGRRKELAGVIGTLANIPKIVSGGQISQPSGFASPTIERFKRRITSIEAGTIKVPAGELAILKQRVAG